MCVFGKLKVFKLYVRLVVACLSIEMLMEDIYMRVRNSCA